MVKALLLAVLAGLVALVVLATMRLQLPVTPADQPGTTAALQKLHDSWYARSYTFPAGGRQLFPDYRLVALYGTPDAPVLGALGDQPLAASLARAKKLARTYQPLMREHALPTVEIIATIASSSPTSNHDYSRQQPLKLLLQWIEAAKRQGVYVVLDLQPGRSDFLTQAKSYELALLQPNVGLALDPEWRLGKNQVHMKQIGSVNINEVNATAGWLAKLVADHQLPQKLFLLHEFRTSMLPDRRQLDTGHAELAYAVQMDGQGDQATKLATWQSVRLDAPAAVHFGWKNFYAKDTPMLSPRQTMQLKPQPWYVSYQ